jgi:transposase-like protein
MLRGAEVGLSQGLTVGKVCRRLEISEQTYYRRRKQHGGMKISQAKRLKELEREIGPEFTAEVVRKWLESVGVRTLFIEPESP